MSSSVAEPSSSPTADPARSARSAEKALLRQEGEYWTIMYSGKALRLKDSTGLSYLAQLLGSPGTDVHALALAGGIAGHSVSTDVAVRQSTAALPKSAEELTSIGMHGSGLGDAGAILDESAKAAYRQRLAELRTEVEEAKQLNQFERAEQAEEESEALLTELARAVGLGGRDRRAASAAERARQSVSRALKAAMHRIAEHDPTLGAMFLRCIKTGTFCSYHPDPSFPIAWEFGVTRHDVDSVPPEQTPCGSPSGRSRADGGITVAGEFLVSQLPSAHRTPFVGRQAECERLRALVDQALSGQGSLVILGGEPGVGKTRLALELAQEASSRGFRVLSGRCYEREKPYPYLPFAEMLETALAQAPSLEEFRQWLGANAAELALIAPAAPHLSGYPHATGAAAATGAT